MFLFAAQNELKGVHRAYRLPRSCGETAIRRSCFPLAAQS